MSRMNPLIHAVRQAQDGNPLANPVTVLCMPGARDAVMDALSQSSVAVGMKVLSLQMFVESQFPGLVDPAEVAALVVHALQELPEDSEIRARGLAGEPATRTGVRKAVWQLLQAPRERWGLTGTRTLPKEIASITERIADRFKSSSKGEPARTLPYEAWEQACIPERTIVWDVVGLTPAEDRLLERLPEPLRPDDTAQVTTMEVADEHVQALAVLSKVRESIAESSAPQEEALDRVGVAMMNQAFYPVLVDAAQGLPLVGGATECLLDAPEVATVVGLVSLEVDTIPQAQLAEILLRGRIGWQDAAGKRPTIFGFDSLSRHRNGPRSWPRWQEFSVDHVVNGEKVPARVEAAWVVALHDDLVALRASESWGEWATQALQLAKKHVQGPVPESLFSNLAQFDQLGIDFSVLAAQEALWEAAVATPLGTDDAFPAGLRVGALSGLVGGDLDVLLVCNASSIFMPHGVPEPAGVSLEQLGTSVERETSRQHEILEAALRTANEVRCIHADQLSGGEFGGEPSHWIPADHTPIDGCEANDFPAASRRTASFTHALRGAWPASTQQTMSVVKARSEGNPSDEFNGFVEGLSDWIADHEFSASALNLYVESPYLFFIQYVAGMRELEADPAEDLDSRDKGTIFHSIVEEWTRRVWLDASPRPASYAELDWDAAREVLDSIAAAHLSAPLLSEVSALSRHAFELRLTKALADWFEAERQQAEAGWMPVGVELAFGRGSDIEVLFDTSFGQVSLKGFIDRVDFHPETRSLRVVDYKTGRNRIAKKDVLAWDNVSSFTVQPDFYGLAMWQAISNGALAAWLDKMGIGEDVVTVSPSVDVDFHFVFADNPNEEHYLAIFDQERYDDFVHVLGSTLELMAQGVFFPRPIDTERFLRTQILRLGANNYVRQADAISDYLFELYQSLTPARENEGEN